MTTLRRWRGAATVLACSPAAVRGDGLGSPARRLLKELGVEVVADSERLSVPATRGTLAVANHLSWLDITAHEPLSPVGNRGELAARAEAVVDGRDRGRGLQVFHA